MTVSVTPTTVPRFNNRVFLLIMRGLWWMVALIAVILILILIPISYELYTQIPVTAGSEPISPEVRALFIEGLAQLGISPQVYAAFKLTLGLVIATASFGMGYLLFRRRFEERIGMIGAFFLTAFGTFALIVPEPYINTGTFAGMLFNLFGWTMAIFAWGGFYLFVIIYPDGRFNPIWSLISPLAWGISIIGTIFPDSPLGAWSGGGSDPVTTTILLALLLGVPLVAQVYRYFRIFTPLQRQQVKWFIAVLAWFALFALVLQPLFSTLLDATQPVNVVLLDVVDGLGGLTFLLLTVAIGVAILRYRLWDLDFVINRSLVYGSVLGLALALFFGVLAGLQILIGQTQPLMALLIAGGASAVLFQPVRRQVQGFVDHRIYRLQIGLNELSDAQKKPEVKNPGALTGKVLGGYEVLGVLGKGGMGEVYKGYKEGQTVALKTLPEELAKQEEFVRRFEREAQVMQTLDHPQIVRVLEQGETDAVRWIAMQYVEGVDLKDHLRSQGKMGLEDTLDLLKDVASALDYAHARGLVHRDIKPSNIMLHGDDPMRALLMDFGIAKIGDAKTRFTASGVIGTIDYMAPEQIMTAREVDGRADVYALAIVAYEMLTGETPFSGGPAQVMFAQLQQPAPDPRSVNGNLPAACADAILTALEKKPAQRFATAGEFVAAMRGN